MVERRFINVCTVGHCRSPLSMNQSEMLPRMRRCVYRLVVNCRSFAGTSTRPATPDCEVITPFHYSLSLMTNYPRPRTYVQHRNSDIDSLDALLKFRGLSFILGLLHYCNPISHLSRQR